jgi:Replication initiator protein A
VDEKTERSKGMTIELSNWFYEGVMMAGGVLAIERAYFRITGGRERWLYKVARKHAGGAGEGGSAISMPTLFEKSGAEGDYRRFKFEIVKIVAKNALPGYALSLEQAEGKREPSLRMRRRTDGERAEPAPRPIRGEGAPAQAPAPKDQPREPLMNPGEAKAVIRSAIAGLSQKAVAGYITDATLERLRSECPGWDYQTLHSEYKAWISGDAKRTPVNYQAAFIGFVKRHHDQHKHTLPAR